MERVDVDQAREALDRGRESFCEGFGRVLDFTGVESADTADLEACSNLRGKTSLAAILLAPRTPRCEYCLIRSRKDNVQELLARGHHGDVLPLRLHFGFVWSERLGGVLGRSPVVAAGVYR